MALTGLYAPAARQRLAASRWATPSCTPGSQPRREAALLRVLSQEMPQEMRQKARAILRVPNSTSRVGDLRKRLSALELWEGGDSVVLLITLLSHARTRRLVSRAKVV